MLKSFFTVVTLGPVYVSLRSHQKVHINVLCRWASRDMAQREKVRSLTSWFQNTGFGYE